MVARSDYPKDEVDVCLSVMVEFMTLLGSLRTTLLLWEDGFLIFS